MDIAFATIYLFYLSPSLTGIMVWHIAFVSEQSLRGEKKFKRGKFQIHRWDIPCLFPFFKVLAAGCEIR